MKHFVLMVFGLLTCFSSIAEDKLTVEAVTIPQGGTGILNVNLSNPDTEFSAFQFRLTTAAGVSIAKDSDSNYLVEKGERLSSDDFDAFSITTTAVSETVYDLLAYQIQTSAFPGTSGTIVQIALTADDGLSVGTTLQCGLSLIQLSDPESNSYDLDDITFDITIGEPDDGRIHFDETATKLPTYTAGEKGDVSMVRSIKAGTWSTIVLPFTLTKAKAETIFGSDVQLAEFSGFEVDYGDDDENVIPLGITINFSSYTMTAKKGMTGGKPFLIKTSTDITDFTADDVTLFDAITDVTKTDEFDTSGKFTGSFTKTEVPADGLFINNETFYYSTGKTAVKAFRGWFELGAVLDKETDFGVKMFVDGFETKVEGVSVRDAAGTVYDLSGRRVTRPQKGGIYIVNGKKALIK